MLEYKVQQYGCTGSEQNISLQTLRWWNLLITVTQLPILTLISNRK